MEQWLEGSSPTNVFWVQFPDPASCGLSLLLVLFLAPRGFSAGTLVFPSPQKQTFSNFNSICIIVRQFIMSLLYLVWTWFQPGGGGGWVGGTSLNGLCEYVGPQRVRCFGNSLLI